MYFLLSFSLPCVGGARVEDGLMGVQHPESWVVTSEEGFTLAELNATPVLRTGAVRSPCRWFGLAWLFFEAAAVVGVCMAEILR